MKRIIKNKIFIISIFLSILLLFFYYAPQLVSTDKIRAIIQTEISDRIDAEIEFENVNISIFPKPRLVFSDIDFSIPKGINGNIKSIEIGPEITSLLKGKFRLGTLVLIGPRIKMDIKAPKNIKSGDNFISKIKRSLEHLKKMTEIFQSDIKLVVEDGKLDFLKDSDYFFKFNGLHADIQVKSGQFQISGGCQSNIWNNIRINCELNLNSFDGQGALEFDRLKPREITDFLYSFTDWRMGDNSITLCVDFVTKGLRNIRANLKSSVPNIILLQKDKKITIEGGELKGFFQIREDIIELVLQKLNLDFPRMNASGKLNMGKDYSDISIDIAGKDIDVFSVKKVAMAVLGKNKIICKIFEILKDGNIPEIHIHSKGKTFKDLLQKNNLNIDGHVMDAHVFIPGVQLDLSEVSGHTSISKGFIAGDHFQARMENSFGCEGNFILGLYKNDSLFHLDLLLDVDLAQVPPLLGRLVNNDLFVREMKNIDKIEGRAKGRLILGESLDDIYATVNITEMEVAELFYGRIPFKIQTHSGTFLYKNNQVSAENIFGSIGATCFSNLSFSILDWEKTAQIKVISDEAEVDISELYPWLNSFDPLNETFELLKLKKLEGGLSIDSLNLKGPLFSPEEWVFNVSGIPDSLMADSRYLEGKTIADGGTFFADQNHITLSQGEIVSYRTKLLTSFRINNYLTGVESFNAEFKGRLGNKNLVWVSNLIDLPDEFRVKGPLNVKSASTYWHQDNSYEVTADFSVVNGPHIDIDIEGDTNDLFIHWLRIEDEKSNALMTFYQTNDEVKLAFNGFLTNDTMDKLLYNNTYFNGFAEGDILIYLNKKTPAMSEVDGHLSGNNVIIPDRKKSVKLDIFDISSDKNGICISPSDLEYSGTSGLVEGGIFFTQKNFVLDINTTSEGLEWDKIDSAIPDKEERATVAKETEKKIKWPISGRIGVQSDYFKYDKETYTSVNADVLFLDENFQIKIHEADICGISISGFFDILPDRLLLKIKPSVKEQDLLKTLNCFSEAETFLKGKYGLEGTIHAEGDYSNFPENFGGELHFEAKTGRVYRFVVLAKIFSVMNLEEILRGDFPNLLKEGFPYKSIKVDGHLKDRRFHLEGIIDNASMGISFNGHIDIENKTLDLTVLVAPFKTVDYIIKRIPVLNEMLDGTLISIPVKVTGNYLDPKIAILDPTVVEEELINIMQKTLNFPFKVMKPIFTNGEQQGQKILKKIQKKQKKTNDKN